MVSTNHYITPPGTPPLHLKSNQVKPTNVQYLRNMQFIQNAMGDFADVRDEIVRANHFLDWTDSEKTFNILKAACLSSIATIFILRYIPFNYVMLALGVGLFLGNSAFMKGLCVSVLPVAEKFFYDQKIYFMKMIKDIHPTSKVSESITKTHRSSPKASVVVVKLFQNERWWAGKCIHI